MHLLHESEFDSGHFMTRLTNHEMGIMTDLTGVWCMELSGDVSDVTPQSLSDWTHESEGR